MRLSAKDKLHHRTSYITKDHTAAWMSEKAGFLSSLFVFGGQGGQGRREEIRAGNRLPAGQIHVMYREFEVDMKETRSPGDYIQDEFMGWQRFIVMPHGVRCYHDLQFLGG
jgi:hypothetical protein